MNSTTSLHDIYNSFSEHDKAQLALLHPISFAKRYFPRLIKVKSPEFHFDMVSAAMNNSRVLFLAPRDHAKSTLFSFIYPLWRIVKDRNIRISMVCDTHTQANKFVDAMRFELENNSKLIQDFGEFRGPNWMKSQFTVSREVNLKDPTISGFGLNSSKLGDRADLIICDDIISEKNCTTEMQREKSTRWFLEVLTNFLEEDGGQILVIGTRQDELDLYGALKENPEYTTIEYRAVLDYDAKKVLWPEKWRYEHLMRRRNEIGRLAFDRQFQNVVTSDESSMFPLKLMKSSLDRELNYCSIHDEKPAWFDDYEFFMGVDLASSARIGADYFVCATLGVDDDKNRILANLFRKRGASFTEQADTIVDLHDYFEHSKIVIESNQYQQVLPDTLREKTDLPILSYQTGPEKHDEAIGVPALRVLFENKKYNLPYAPESSERTDILLNEFTGLAFSNRRVVSTTAHKDTVLAVWLAEIGVRETPMSNRFTIISSSY